VSGGACTRSALPLRSIIGLPLFNLDASSRLRSGEQHPLESSPSAQTALGAAARRCGAAGPDPLASIVERCEHRRLRERRRQ
jgi:hypothetical protein